MNDAFNIIVIVLYILALLASNGVVSCKCNNRIHRLWFAIVLMPTPFVGIADWYGLFSWLPIYWWQAAMVLQSAGAAFFGIYTLVRYRKNVLWRTQEYFNIK